MWDLKPACIVVATLAVFAFACLKPHRNFEDYVATPAPDYSIEHHWAALPWVYDSADVLPPFKGLNDNQSVAEADVFYIHPTLFFENKGWNASMDDYRCNNMVDRYAMRHQAAIFNGCCRVFAPRYRQATLSAFIDGSENSKRSLDTAYADIKDAFKYYLVHHNNGRPIVLAGHSQGSVHAQRLIKDFFEKDSLLRKQLVVAYLVGGSAAKNMFTTLVPCDSAAQTNCYVAWHARKWETDFDEKNDHNAKWPAYENIENYECVNPLTWRRDTTYAPASLNRGSLPATYDVIHPGIADAKISPSCVLWVHPVRKRGYPVIPNYHTMDFNLFWINIRENAELRVSEFLKNEQVVSGTK